MDVDAGVRHSALRDQNATSLEVLIVGAGTSGLMAAVLLAEYGIQFQIIDRRNVTGGTGLSECLQPRVLEVLESLGLREEMERAGLKICEYAVYERSTSQRPQRIRAGREVVSPASYPYSVMIDKGDVEKILESKLRSLGHQVRHGVELLNIKRSAQQVVHLKSSASGKVESVYVPFILGCDGPSQLTRRLARIESEDFGTYNWLVADVVAATDFPDSRRRCTFHAPDGSFTLVPIKNDMFRCRTMIFTEDAPLAGARLSGLEKQKIRSEDKVIEANIDIDDLTLALVGKIARYLDPYELVVSKVSWQRLYMSQKTLAKSFANEKLSVFLLGSACHVQSPLTRQHINRGMMDAWNLCWKLASVINGSARPDILVSFDLEQRSTLLRAMEFESQVDNVYSRTDVVDELTGLHDFEAATPYTSGCGLRYPANPLVKEEVRTYIQKVPYAIAPGKRLSPARLVRQVDGVEEHIWTFMPAALQFRLILFLGHIVKSPIVEGMCRYLDSQSSRIFRNVTTGNLHQSLVDLWVVHTLSHLEIQIQDLLQPFHRYKASVFEDTSGNWHRALGVSPKLGCLCLVRPDGYVGIVSNLDNCDSVSTYLDKLYY